jgi:hypothetical protein
MTVPKPTANSLASRPHEWLLLVYQLPAKPSNIRVRTWRRLQQVGAVGLKNSAYVLPNSSQAKEDFEWIKAEIAAMKGQANVFLADHVDATTEQEIAAAFRNVRQTDFRNIARDAKKLLPKVKRGRLASPVRRRLARTLRTLRERWNEAVSIDFFQAPGREEAGDLLEQMQRNLAENPRMPKSSFKSGESLMKEKFRSRTWVTRPRPGIDRMSSGWLIRRFIDSEAKFAFAEKAEEMPDAVPFDMFGVELSHEGNACTFETLLKRFGIKGPALARIGQIVHNLDLKDERYEVPEAIAVGRLVEGLRQIHADDHKLLEHGVEIFEALYRSLTNTPPSEKVSSNKAGRKEPRSYLGLS